MKLSFKERFGPRVQVQDVVRVGSGSPAKLLLKSKPGRVKGPQAALALIKRHVQLREAHDLITLLFDAGEVVITVPKVENAAALIRELAKCNVSARLMTPADADGSR